MSVNPNFKNIFSVTAPGVEFISTSLFCFKNKNKSFNECVLYFSATTHVEEKQFYKTYLKYHNRLVYYPKTLLYNSFFITITHPISSFCLKAGLECHQKSIFSYNLTCCKTVERVKIKTAQYL